MICEASTRGVVGPIIRDGLFFLTLCDCDVIERNVSAHFNNSQCLKLGCRAARQKSQGVLLELRVLTWRERAIAPVINVKSYRVGFPVKGRVKS